MKSTSAHFFSFSLIIRWTFQLPEDVVHDFTFKSDMCNGDSPGLREQSYGSDSGLLKQEDEQSRGGSYDRRSTDSTSIAIEGFKEHCLMVADVYSKSFVTGNIIGMQFDLRILGLLIFPHNAGCAS